MSRRDIKKTGSNSGLGRKGEETQETQRDVTPPSSSIPMDDTLTTDSPHQIIETGTTTTPADAIITTPQTNDQSSPAKSSLVKRILNSFKSQSNIHHAAETTVQKRIHTQGITGSDLSLPIFTGLSKNPNDHFIDIDTDSMETAPDIRVYFWELGSAVQGASVPPVDLEDRRVFDAKLVRAGREYLRSLRERGEGWFMSPGRSLAEKNEPGTLWHRMPTAGICADIADCELEPMEDECFFFDPDREDTSILLTRLVPTNLRVPLWWAESLKEGVVPGTEGWDRAVYSSYTHGFHPAHCMYIQWERDEMVLNIVRMNAGSPTDGIHPVDRVKAEEVLHKLYSFQL